MRDTGVEPGIYDPMSNEITFPFTVHDVDTV